MNYDLTSVERFEKLYEIIPKTPHLWNEDDVGIWLKFLNLDQYLTNFKENSVDGYLILELNEEELKEELKITTKLHLKKIINAIEILKNYSKYIKEYKSTNNELAYTNFQEIKKNEKMKIEPIKENYEKENLEKENMEEEKIIENIINDIDDEEMEMEEEIKEIEKEREKENESVNQNINVNINENGFKEYIIIKSIEVPYTSKHQIDKKGSKIGRHSTNDIVIFDESVSRYHAIIEYMDNNFKLKDIGSTTGTFLKINEPIVIQKDMIIEIGSYQFLIDQISINQNNKDDNYLVLTIYESPEERESETYILNNGSTIGRKNNNTIFFQEDMHMSNMHCKVNLIGDKFYFEDYASTNGSWLRLSKEGENSNYINLDLKTIFKIGNSAMYQTDEIKLRDEENDINKEFKPIEESNQNTKCCICWDNERDCFIEPCKHNVSCMKCTKGIKNCPICRRPIDDMIKIYKA